MSASGRPRHGARSTSQRQAGAGSKQQQGSNRAGVQQHGGNPHGGHGVHPGGEGGGQGAHEPGGEKVAAAAGGVGGGMDDEEEEDKEDAEGDALALAGDDMDAADDSILRQDPEQVCVWCVGGWGGGAEGRGDV